MTLSIANLRIIRTALALIALLSVGGSDLMAQGAPETGRIVGRIIDGESAQPIAGAQVFLSDQSIGARSDINGRYVLDRVPAGLLSVTVQMIGYGTKTVTEIDVQAGAVVELDISIENQAVALAALTVTAEAERGSASALLEQRRISSAVTDAVGAQEIRRSPDSDAADVAQRMTGVTVSDGKYVFVRGLGERYSQTSFNGSPLPSPEPEREVVPLDIFPSGFLESLTTQKSYTPDRPGDFSGGSVEIKTKDFPNRFQLSFGMGTSFNSMSQFEDSFLTYDGGGRDYLGSDDGTREFPDEARTLIGGLSDAIPLPRDAANAFVREAVGELLPRNFTPFRQDTPLNRSFDVSVGGRAGLGEERELGFFVAGTYSDNYTIRDEEVERKFRVSAFDPSIDESLRIPNVEFAFDKGTRSVAIGAIGNLAFNLSPSHQFRIKTTFNRNTDDEARFYSGFDNEGLGGQVESNRLRYVSRNLMWGQLSGDHQIFAGSRIEWKGSIARADRDEPGLRETVFAREGDTFFLEDSGESGRYFYSELVDDDLNGQLDWTFPFQLSDRNASIKFGGAYRTRERDFAARRLRWNFQGGVFTEIDDNLTDESIVGRTTGAGQFELTEIVEPGDLYDAQDDRVAGYLMADLPLGENLRAIVGARVEKYDLAINSRGNEIASLDETDILPAVNVVYDLNPEMKLRGAVSRTLDRPEFRELAPFQFTEATSLRQVFGEPTLRQAEIVNADLRWDWFFAPGELFSASAFYKDLTDPIEQVFVSAASTAYSFTNAGEGELLGIELESRVRLERLSESLQNFTAGANVTIIDSEVRVSDTGTFEPTNEVRELEGQASYVVNTNIGYSRPLSGWEAGLFYNIMGERLTAAGGGGIPDIFEQPRSQLDLTVAVPFPGDVKAKFKATNLLDSEYVFEQSANGITQVQRRFKTGRTFSVGLSWAVY